MGACFLYLYILFTLFIYIYIYIQMQPSVLLFVDVCIYQLLGLFQDPADPHVQAFVIACFQVKLVLL